MYKLYMDLLYISGIEDAYKCDTDGLMYYSGFNLGNYAFRHGLSKLINVEEHKRVNWRGCREFLSDNGLPSELLLSCANWIGNSEHEERANGTRFELIKKMDCKTIPISIGVQSHVGVNDFTLGKNTKNLVSLLGERSEIISVRDEYTKEVLSRFGVENTLVTGCPSNFINPDKNLGQTISDKAKSLLDCNLDLVNTRYHISEFSGGNKLSNDVFKRCLRLLDKSCGFYILQGPELLPFLLRESDSVPKGIKINSRNLKAQKIINRKSLHFSNIEHWLDFSRTCDISLGMRIHGNIIPMQATVPSLVIHHDSRTQGLSKTMNIPSMDIKEFINIKSKRYNTTILSHVIDGTSGYDNRRLELFDNFKRIFEANNINMINN